MTTRTGRAAELLVLTNFAVAQPLFDVLARNAAFFTVRRSEPADVLVLVLLLCLGVPGLLIGLEALVGRIGPRVETWLHGLLAAALLGLLALQALSRVDALAGLVALGLATLFGVAGALALRRARPLRQMIAVLTPAPLFFAGLFLFGSPVRDLVFGRDEAAAGLPAITADTPVVMVVFDEFNGTWLMDESRRIDPVRYPSLAALAGEATWFRNATTVSDNTVFAVPAILTGRMPDPEERPLPTFANYPENLFTLLAGAYDLRVTESVARLCPESLCPEVAPEPFERRLRSLMLDLSVVYLHLALVPELTGGLPVVSQSWQEFTKDAHDRLAVRKTSRVALFARYVESIAPTRRPPLFFLHVLLPHTPWRYLPSGRPYEGLGDAGVIEGQRNDTGVWSDDEWVVLQAFQRYLLQVAMVDRRIGELVARLKAQGLYDRSLIVVTADHGISFRPGASRRAATDDTLADIMSVPLIVKAPFQRRGVVSDRNVESIDILPTIADLLDIEIPWRVDGRSAFDTSGWEREVETMVASGDGRVSRVEATVATLEPSLARTQALFGSGSQERIYRLGRHADLVGRAIEEARLGDVADVAMDLDWPGLYDAVDPEGVLVPARVKGRVIVAGKGRSRLDLAVALNGRIEAVTRTLPFAGEVARFSAMIPERAFRSGRNAVDVFVVTGPPGRAVLRPARRATGVTYALLEEDGSPRITASDGRSMPLVPGALEGWVDGSMRTADGTALVGWAADVAGGRPAETVLVFIDGEFRLATTTGTYRLDMARRYGDTPLARSGFQADLPSALVGELRDADVRLFAVSRDGVASELPTSGLPRKRTGTR